MTVKTADILTAIDELAPFDLAEEWDNVGLLVGSAERDVLSILIGLDLTGDLLDEAVESGADTIVSHHPMIFRPLSAIRLDQHIGRLLEKAVTNRITVIGCHTNLDSVSGGVSDALGQLLGLTNLRPLQPVECSTKPGSGMGRIGEYEMPLSGREFITKLLEALGLDGVQVAGRLPKQIRTIGLCGGSGSELARIAYEKGSDCYLTAEIKHSTARWAEEKGFCVIDGTHYGTEQPVVAGFAEKLVDYKKKKGWSIDVNVSRRQCPPFQLIRGDQIF